MPIGFEWDDKKAAANSRDHDGVTFEQAAAAFSDTFAVEWIDERADYGEERSVLLGMTGGQLFYVAYTERGTNIRIISVRRATRHEHDIYFRQNAE
jgi:uncharacterized DUF497 family protein